METRLQDPLEELVGAIGESVRRCRERMAESPWPCGSRALAFAVEAGLPPQMAYTIAETAAYTGVSRDTLKREHRAGRLAFVLPNGAEKGYRIRVEEVDRWLEENTR